LIFIVSDYLGLLKLCLEIVGPASRRVYLFCRLDNNKNKTKPRLKNERLGLIVRLIDFKRIAEGDRPHAIRVFIAHHDLDLDLASFCYFFNLALANRSG